ncbi:MAG TPA: pentapeptide repeat-containing protein [Roseiflexaceae bacterium]|jgi:uncharacterized protein YjbI with pentapeptide repeats
MRSHRQQHNAGTEAPQLPSRLDSSGLTAGQIDEQGSYTGLLLSSCDLSEQAAEDVTFEATLFKHVALSRTRLASLRLHDVRLDACDLAEAAWEKTLFNRVEVLGCRMVGWRASDGSLRNVLIKGCNGIGAQFWSTVFKGVRFENCILRDADFQRADLSGVVFDKCDLSNAKMSDAKLAGADFRGSKIEGVRLGLKELQGAIVDVEQAIGIARLLGVVVKMD